MSNNTALPHQPGFPPPTGSARNSKENSKLPPPPPPPPPTHAIPLGLAPDGKSLLPKLGADGEPLKGPPLDKDGKPLPPPPIIGLDGKEIPRPTDEKGNPLPIYVAPDGKPILDVDGKPIALKFNKEGKPIPLEMEFLEGSPPDDAAGGGDIRNAPGVGGGHKKDQIPNTVMYTGFIDAALSLIIFAVVAYFAYETNNKNPDGLVWKLLAVSAILCLLGASCGALPFFATKKNKANFLWLWFGLGVIFLICELVFTFAPGESPPNIGSIISAAYCGIRVIFILFVACYVAGPSTPETQQPQYYQYPQAPRDAYPKSEMSYYSQQQIPQVQTSSTMVVQQPVQTVMVHQPVMSYGFGYGYPSMAYGAGLGGWGGYGGWGGWGGYGMGWGGYGCGGYCPYYDYGWW